MSGFLGAIGIVGILSGLVLFVLGFIKKKKYRGGWIALASIILVIIAVETTPATATEESKELTTEEKVIEELGGEKTNEDKERLVSYEKKENSIEIVLAGDQSIDNKSTVESMLLDAKEAFSILFEEDVDRVVISLQQTFVDTYGEESEDDAVKIILSSETNDKINWENFNIDNFAEVADTYYVHPGIE